MNLYFTSLPCVHLSDGIFDFGYAHGQKLAGKSRRVNGEGNACIFNLKSIKIQPENNLQDLIGGVDSRNTNQAPTVIDPVNAGVFTLNDHGHCATIGFGTNIIRLKGGTPGDAFAFTLHFSPLGNAQCEQGA